MPVPFIMPKFDMDQETATIASWLKGEGEAVELDETVLVVETEKIAIEVTAPAAGVLAQICAREGDVVPVTEVIAYILKPGETMADLPGGGRVVEAAPPPAALKPAAATPVAQRMAHEQGVDLSQVPAEGGRVRRADVERFLLQRAGAPGGMVLPATPAARRLGKELGVDLAGVEGRGPRGRIQAEDVRSAAVQKTVEERTPLVHTAPAQDERPAKTLPLAGMRRTIADRMQTSFQTLPHIALTIEVDVTHLEQARQNTNQRAEKHGTPSTSLTAWLVRICAWALERQPWINASLLDGTVYQWEEINVGVATALEEGLIVPVIHQANSKPLRQIAAELGELTTRARRGQLTLPDVQHGTFTISNLGMFGIQQFRAIINPPEAAILAVGAVVRKPVVINDQDEVAVRPMLALTLAADHRLVDGVTAARFLADIAAAIENPEMLLY
jgi:pyruvate dehydrogenase E2 component (dihydrolipoamide acetyltransferase)